jgi:hypothetical protein
VAERAAGPAAGPAAVDALTREPVRGIAAVRPDAPREYVVRRGDTLWGIAGRFLPEPWYWPQVWRANPAIENPHLIYPGDVVELVQVDGRTRMQVRRGRRLSPQVRREPLVEPEPEYLPEKQEQVEAEPEPEPEQEPPAPVPTIIPLDQLKKTNRCPDCNLEKADLQGWKLKGADLNGANLGEANLSGADLSGANLSGANLMWANLKGANLENADIGGTDFRGAELSGATGPKGTKCSQDSGSACLE